MPGERARLIRRNFEAYRDLTWFEELEPRFRGRGVEGGQLQSFREAWNEHAEARDWAWWQKESAGKPAGRLEDEVMDIVERLDALGCLRWLEEKTPGDQHAGSRFGDLAKELRADYVAAKREDAHRYGRPAPQEPPPRQDGYDGLLKQYADAGVNHKPQEKDKGQGR